MELRTKASRSDAVTERERENLQVAYRAAFAKTAQLEPGQGGAGTRPAPDRSGLRRCCANVVKSIFDSETQREYIG